MLQVGYDLLHQVGQNNIASVRNVLGVLDGLKDSPLSFWWEGMQAIEVYAQSSTLFFDF